MEEQRTTGQRDLDLEWTARAREYCSQIDVGAGASVRVFRRGQPGPCLVLKPDRRRRVAVVDGAEHPIGWIQTERHLLLPRYVMYRDDTIVWTLAATSVLRCRYTLKLVSDVTWSIRTPFFSVQLGGEAADGARVRGRVGRRTHEWRWLAEPDSDSDSLVSALAFMHRQWYFH